VRIELHDSFYLSPVREGDQEAYVEHFQDKELTDCLIRIPYPYTEANAEYWVRYCVETGTQNGHPHHFAFRRADGFLVGGIGLHAGTGICGHKAELGYWLVQAYRGRGLATAGARAIARYAFEELGLKRVEATASSCNTKSQHVLEKAGFASEGFLTKYHVRNGTLIDVYMYSILDSTEHIWPRHSANIGVNR
jgi:[ribosomal protein S5]-alanine N-acetyltransferase